MIGCLHDWLHALSAGACPAAKRHAHAIVPDQAISLLRKRRCVGRPVSDDPLHRPAQKPTGLINLFDCQNLGIDHRFFADGHRAGLRVEQAYHDWAAIDEQAIHSKPDESRRSSQSEGKQSVAPPPP
jgi:hypothetical protein